MLTASEGIGWSPLSQYLCYCLLQPVYNLSSSTYSVFIKNAAISTNIEREFGIFLHEKNSWHFRAVRVPYFIIDIGIAFSDIRDYYFRLRYLVLYVLYDDAGG